MLSNFHAHTNYCDGKNTCEEMVLAAIAQGLDAFGISEHSHTSVPDDTGNITPENMPKYFAEMRALAECHADKIDIFVGLEQDRSEERRV